MRNLKKIAILALIGIMSTALLNGATNTGTVKVNSKNTQKGPISIKKQGIFSAGGTVITSPGTFNPEDQWEATGKGQTAYVDHANVFYQLPQNEKGVPMVFLHGYGQSRTGWQTTPDGREG